MVKGINKYYIIVSSILLIQYGCFLKPETTRKEYNLEELEAGFKNPPAEARPRAIWNWIDGNYELGEMSKELAEAKEIGLGGLDIQDITMFLDVENNKKGHEFMDDNYTNAVFHALTEAKKLDLEMGLIIGSGRINTVTKWIPPGHQPMELFSTSIIVHGPAHVDQNLIIPKTIENSEFKKDIAIIAFPVEKDSVILSKVDVIDLSGKFHDGVIIWDVPKGTWKITRYICANAPSSSIAGYGKSMIDQINPEAIENHIEYLALKLREKIGPLNKSSLKYFHGGQSGTSGQLWSPGFQEEFINRKGYNPIPFLPVLEGYSVINKEVSSRFLFDFRKVLSETLISNYFNKGNEVCKHFGIEFSAKTVNNKSNIPFEHLESSGLLGVARGTFNHIVNGEGDEFFIKGVASASHLYDRRIVEGELMSEACSWLHGPGDLKPALDHGFCEGMNRVVFPSWFHTPHKEGIAAWSCSTSTSLEEKPGWTSKASAWLSYLSRCSFLLQEGLFKADVLYYQTDSSSNIIPAKKFDPYLGYGYDYDFINTDILLTKVEVVDVKLVWPHGSTYEILVLPNVSYMLCDVLKKIEKLVAAGATVIGPKPIKSHGLKEYKDGDLKVKILANTLWGSCDGKNVTEHQYGKGKINWGITIRDALLDKGIEPDIDFLVNEKNEKIDFIHRQSSYADIYFIRNTTNEKFTGNLSFRIPNKFPEIWDPVTGNTAPCRIMAKEKDRVVIPVDFLPYESFFVVFTNRTNKNFYSKVKKNGQTIFPANINDETPPMFEEYNGDIVCKTPGKYVFEKEKGKKQIIDVNEIPGEIIIAGTWELHVKHGRNEEDTLTWDKLHSWKEKKETRNFTGVITYFKDFDIPASLLQEKYRMVLDLGKVNEVAHVFLNGKDMGILWKPPYLVDITNILLPGANELRVEVGNSKANLRGNNRDRGNEAGLIGPTKIKFSKNTGI